MRKYETLYLTDREKEKIEGINTRLREVVEQNQGVFLKAEDWGTRQLTFTINRVQRGNYVRLVYELAPRLVGEIDRVLRFQDGVLRYRTTLLKTDPASPYDPPEILRDRGQVFEPKSVSPGVETAGDEAEKTEGAEDGDSVETDSISGGTDRDSEMSGEKDE